MASDSSPSLGAGIATNKLRRQTGEQVRVFLALWAQDVTTQASTQGAIYYIRSQGRVSSSVQARFKGPTAYGQAGCQGILVAAQVGSLHIKLNVCHNCICSVDSTMQPHG